MSDRPGIHQLSRLEPPDPPPGGLMGAEPLSRRDLLRRAALAAGALGASGLLAACGAGSGGGSGNGEGQPVAGSLSALAANVQALSLLNAQTQLPAGHSRFAFGLSAENNRLVQGVAPQVWFAKDRTSRALGPFRAHWLEMTGYEKTGDRSPRSDLTGFYVAEVDLPTPGTWLGVALVDVATQRAAGQGTIPVSERVVAPVGATARSGPSPVATTPSGLAKVCTREPACPMHDISLDQALKSGKPTVLSFATPLLCASRMCGPVVDEQLVAFEKLDKRKANFIHLEIYPQRDTNKPAPLFADWGLESEPWLVVIDRTGVIRFRGEGPIAASEIQAALQPLLA
jgi:hypothetical protein